jgi:hypothetical protein
MRDFSGAGNSRLALEMLMNRELPWALPLYCRPSVCWVV